MNGKTFSDRELSRNEVIFVRTSKGDAAIREHDCNFPRKLRALLIAVNGRTPLRVFSKLLPNFGNVSASLGALEAGGYIAATTAAVRIRAATHETSNPSLLGAASPFGPRRFDASSITFSEQNSSLLDATRVQRARTLMADFLLEHFADTAMDAILKLERLETHQQFISNLPHYQRFVATAGEKADAHFAAVKTALYL